MLVDFTKKFDFFNGNCFKYYSKNYKQIVKQANKILMLY